MYSRCRYTFSTQRSLTLNIAQIRSVWCLTKIERVKPISKISIELIFCAKRTYVPSSPPQPTVRACVCMYVRTDQKWSKNGPVCHRYHSWMTKMRGQFLVKSVTSQISDIIQQNLRLPRTKFSLCFMHQVTSRLRIRWVVLAIRASRPRVVV